MNSRRGPDRARWLHYRGLALAVVLLALTSCTTITPPEPTSAPARSPAPQPASTTQPPAISRPTSALRTLIAPTLAATLAPPAPATSAAPPPAFAPPTATPPLPEAVITAENLAALRLLRTVGDGSVTDAAIAPGGKLLAVATSAGVALFQLPTRQHVRFMALA